MTRDDVPADFTRALDRDAADILRYLERRLGAEDAADALAEVMVAAWRRADAIPADPEQSRMWLFGIARNVLANTRRSEQRRGKLADRLRATLTAARAGGAPADEGLEVRDAIGRLAPDQAELVRLIHWEGFAVAAAGEILGISASTARTRYQRARADLKQALSVSSAATGVSNSMDR
ncbi:RNA polymerase sigma factor [Compostimonas suwonensis]|uniref:RNA polymerase sigma-70 factor (ECF subfamily) n=1 Tax=Compostimonas suwonensis TaxID=1048394 RepID=A0A2M9C4C1_9MICO|nr:RNA polymerase sigma factor [Compostimonas suwonensis]PJJ65380.1 RNA polymerase sigma-70 factor (ECF subfamily) [Compostimonas suwonensis]